MAMAPLNLALAQPKSSGTSKWARILGGGLAGASFLPQLEDHKLAKDAMLSGGLGMLATGSPWGATAAIPSALMNLRRGASPGSSEGGMYGPGINEPVLPNDPLTSTPISGMSGLAPALTGQMPTAPAAVPRKSKWTPSAPAASGQAPFTMNPPAAQSPWTPGNINSALTPEILGRGQGTLPQEAPTGSDVPSPGYVQTGVPQTLNDLKIAAKKQGWIYGGFPSRTQIQSGLAANKM